MEKENEMTLQGVVYDDQGYGLMVFLPSSEHPVRLNLTSDDQRLIMTTLTDRQLCRSSILHKIEK